MKTIPVAPGPDCTEIRFNYLITEYFKNLFTQGEIFLFSRNCFFARNN